MADVRLIFDEHMRKAVANGLRRRGISVQTAHELGRRGLSDETQLRLAATDGCAIVTHDEDYLALTVEFVERGEFFAGVVFCDPDQFQYNPGLLIRELVTLVGVYSAEDMHNHVEYL